MRRSTDVVSIPKIKKILEISMNKTISVKWNVETHRSFAVSVEEARIIQKL